MEWRRFSLSFLSSPSHLVGLLEENKWYANHVSHPLRRSLVSPEDSSYVHVCIQIKNSESLSNLQMFRMQIHICVLKFCQSDKIAIRICVFTYKQLCPWHSIYFHSYSDFSGTVRQFIKRRWLSRLPVCSPGQQNSTINVYSLTFLNRKGQNLLIITL